MFPGANKVSCGSWWPSFDPLLINNDQDPLLGLEQCDGQSEEGGQDLVHRLQWGLPVPAASGSRYRIQIWLIQLFLFLIKLQR